MRIMNLLVTALTLTSILGSAANADIVLTKNGQASGYSIKVIKDGSKVSYQLFDGATYMKNLGDQVSYETSKIAAYNESLPAKIKSDHSRKTWYKIGGGVIGLAGGIIATRLIANTQPRSGGMFGNLAQGLAALIALVPCTAGGTMLGWWGGSKVSDLFFASAEQDELRAVLTSAAFLENDRSVLDVKDALQAAAELDSALKEVR